MGHNYDWKIGGLQHLAPAEVFTILHCLCAIYNFQKLLLAFKKLSLDVFQDYKQLVIWLAVTAEAKHSSPQLPCHSFRLFQASCRLFLVLFVKIKTTTQFWVRSMYVHAHVILPLLPSCSFNIMAGLSIKLALSGELGKQQTPHLLTTHPSPAH